MSNQDKYSQKSFRKEAIKSWQEYQETGLHVTGDEIINWLASWGTGNKQEAPECHREGIIPTQNREPGKTVGN